jgi:hypothetical protein
MMANKNLPNHPIAAFELLTDNFYKAVLQAFTTFWSIIYPMYYPYWDGDYGNMVTWIEQGESPADSTEWLGRAVLKYGRLGVNEMDYQKFQGVLMETTYFSRGTVEQDFGDYVAFILTKTAIEKEAFYADVAARRNTARQVVNVETGKTGSDNRNGYPHGGSPAVEVIKQKVDLVKNWFQNSLNITLQEPTATP